jgi:hypothetical protein
MSDLVNVFLAQTFRAFLNKKEGMIKFLIYYKATNLPTDFKLFQDCKDEVECEREIQLLKKDTAIVRVRDKERDKHIDRER